MKCPHAETTTLLWIYGEGPEGHEAHVANCAICQEVLKTHETVQFHLSEMEPSVGEHPIVQVPVVPEPANQGWAGIAVGVSGLALAVAAVFVAWIGFSGIKVPVGEAEQSMIVQVTDEEPMDEDISVTNQTSEKEVVQVANAKAYWDFDGFGDDWDEVFDALEEDLEILEEELSTL